MQDANANAIAPELRDGYAIYEGDALAGILAPVTGAQDRSSKMIAARLRAIIANEPGWTVTRYTSSLSGDEWQLIIRSPFAAEYVCENLTDVAAAIMDYTDALVIDNAALREQRMESRGEFHARFGRYPTDLELDLWLDGKYYPMGDILTRQPSEDEVYAYIGQ